ncbi:4Fe-4S dicluster domain-containing protein [Natranaerobius thermophilus]|uniref:4Fe-4S ferredoxin iron-sulfur binding domain protein n=1 Tax=Natranaerobius thermophilus (strain ATCC BAA-1301 / DSM 18059 / JW/NM-WN-LF) TaxID=457570 RepID=B2A312_NATTJ|nr:4Fe-4S binding protein [Natranaerobius thermophilus]ACB83624.1 4Fe-4S ferredoxin iron-sulfur binding domain protein [Natranaerobius thermophilus JW/NM-WN-LF]
MSAAENYQKLTYEKEGKGKWHLFPGLCKGCGLCMEKCPKNVISWSDQLGVYGTPAVEIDAEGCIYCGICEQVCPDVAIKVEKEKKK